VVVASTGVSRQKVSNEPSVSVFDPKEALARVDGDIELMSNLVDLFLTESVAMMEAIRAAVANKSSGKVEKTAHRLKGSVSIFGAKIVSETALALETMGREGNLASASKTFALLEQEMAHLQFALKKFHQTLQSSS
jgi:two-component system, sensor histidine kinase and response regulator